MNLPLPMYLGMYVCMYNEKAGLFGVPCPSPSPSFSSSEEDGGGGVDDDDDDDARGERVRHACGIVQRTLLCLSIFSPSSLPLPLLSSPLPIPLLSLSSPSPLLSLSRLPQNPGEEESCSPQQRKRQGAKAPGVLQPLVPPTHPVPQRRRGHTPGSCPVRSGCSRRPLAAQIAGRRPNRTRPAIPSAGAAMAGSLTWGC